jgi:shikimate kinase
MTHRNIVLTGFTGTGKTAVGREVAARTGRPFVDLDDLIEQRAGKSIPEIFAQDGEPAFRALEAAICGEMAAPAGLVIATGGGAVVNPANREALAAGGTVICLEADLETILQRVGRGDDRPMLASPDRVARIRELLAARAEAYAALPHHLDRAHLTISATAERVLGIAAALPEGGHVLPVRDEGRARNDQTDTSSFIIRPTGMLRDRSSFVIIGKRHILERDAQRAGRQFDSLRLKDAGLQGE